MSLEQLPPGGIMSKRIDMESFIEKIMNYVHTDHSGENMPFDLAFRDHFIELYEMALAVAGEEGYARTKIDYSRIQFWDLSWLMWQVSAIPHAEVGAWEGEITEEDLLRDSCLMSREHTTVSLHNVLALKRACDVENYF